MGRIFEALEAFLDSDHWPMSVAEEHKTVKTGFNGDHGEFVKSRSSLFFIPSFR